VVIRNFGEGVKRKRLEERSKRVEKIVREY
jgi:hypothetical protein